MTIDVLFIDTLEGGEIEHDLNDNLIMTDGIGTAIYLCLFGGNIEDDGSAATEKMQWWGNDGEPEERKFRSKFQSLLLGQPFTSALRVKLEESAKYDIKNGISYVSDVNVEISFSIKRIDLEIKVWLKNGTEEFFELEVNL